MAVSEIGPRGSAKLSERLAAKGSAITAEDLRAEIGIPKNVDFTLLRWMTRGTPQYLEIAATVQCKHEVVGEVVQKIINTRELQGIQVFPYGIPQPDLALVSFTNVPQEF